MRKKYKKKEFSGNGLSLSYFKKRQKKELFMFSNIKGQNYVFYRSDFFEIIFLGTKNDF